MRGIKRKDDGRWKKASIFVGLSLVFIILLNSVYRVYKKKVEAERALVQVKTELSELEERGALLEETLERLNTEEGIEFEIRRKLNVAGEGERVAIIVEQGGSTSTPEIKKSFWQKIKYFFINLID